MPSVLTLPLGEQLLPLRDGVLALNVPPAALARVFMALPQLLLCTAAELTAQVRNVLSATSGQLQ